MPSLIFSPFKITNVTGSSTVNFGDVFQIAPKSTEKAYHGSGGSNVGEFILTNTFFSNTKTIDPDVFDSTITRNK